MTDSEREQAHLDELFHVSPRVSLGMRQAKSMPDPSLRSQNAKAGAGSDEEEEEKEPVRSKHAIVDDDDW